MMEDILKDLIKQFNPYPTDIKLDICGNSVAVYVDGVYFSTYLI